MRERTVSYCCLQTTVRGTAASAHVFGIVKGLRDRGWKVGLHRVRYRAAGRDPSVLNRLLEFLRVQLHVLHGARRVGIVYIRNHFATFPLALFCKLAGRPVVQELNGPYEDNFIAWPVLKRIRQVVEFVVQRQIQWADAVITVTPQLRDWVLRERGKGGVHVVPNAADVELFRPTPGRDPKLPNCYVFFFGALTRWQGIDDLIAAAANPQWPDGVSLVLAGYGALEQAVREAAERNPRIFFLGKVDHDRLPPVITGSLCATIVSNNLGNRGTTGLSPLKLYESLACGVPVIVTDYPGQADLVRNFDCGLVVPPGDAAALAAAVTRLFQDPEARAIMGANGRAAIAEHHSWQARAQATDRILTRIVRHR